MTTSHDLLLGFYGDDFTGSTDAMEGLTRAGLRTVMFIGRPKPEQLAKYEGLRAVGLAGCSRTMSPAEMDVELGNAFRTLKDFNLPMVHYKVCSTFDSSPTIGSIGHALDIGAEAFESSVVPLQAGAPILGRYCVFGNLFARSGLDTEPFRLDRHPTMKHHPITPMTESDLRVHLLEQTDRRIDLLDILSVDDAETAAAKYKKLVDDGAQIVLIDVLYRQHEPIIGQVLCDQAQKGKTLFIVGSSGVEYSLTGYWKSQGMLPEPKPLTSQVLKQVMVVSGSCSPVTDRQIGWALDNGAVDIPLKTENLVDPETAQAEIQATVAKALELYATGKTVICHCARGPKDPRREATVKRFTDMGHDAKTQSGKVLGAALGEILLRILKQGDVKRSIVTGGDTSFFVAERLGIEALEMVAPITPGCPLCKAYVPGSPLDGMEIAFKGGQNGKDDYFATVLDTSKAQY